MSTWPDCFPIARDSIAIRRNHPYLHHQSASIELPQPPAAWRRPNAPVRLASGPRGERMAYACYRCAADSARVSRATALRFSCLVRCKLSREI
jgi:hypothetical protein